MALQQSGEQPGTVDPTLKLLYHISRELASDLDLKTVLLRVLQLSLEAIGGNSGSIIVLDINGNPVDSAIVHTGQMVDHTTRTLSTTLKHGLAGWVAEHRQAVVVQDTSKDNRWARRPDDAPDKTGPKSAMSTPLLVKDQLVGVMTLVHPTPGTFTEQHGSLIRTIADQAAFAVLNARLYEESQRQARAMSALAESAMAITTSLGTEDLLSRVLAQVQKALDVEAVSLALRNPDRDTLTVRASIGEIRKEVLGMQFRSGLGIAGRVAKNGESLVVLDTGADPHFDSGIDGQTVEPTWAVACAPIRTEGEVIGIIEAFNPLSGKFDPETELLLAGIGSLAGSVIRYGQLFERLQAAHRSYRDLFDDSIDLILITDWEGRITQFNHQAAAAIQIPEGDLAGMNVFELHDFGAQEFNGSFLTRLALLETVTYESELQAAAGPLPVQIHVRQIRFENDDLLQWLMHDITERKTMDALRDELISMIYHDLRSPLANVMYAIDMIESSLDDSDSTSRSLIDVANRAANRIQRLTASLLDIRSLEAGQPVTNRASVRAVDCIENAVLAIRPQADSKEQELEEVIELDAHLVRVNEDMITRVLINLLENAVKYTPSDGRITIGAVPLDGEIRFWVQDNGPGIPREYWPGIFDKYTRVDDRNTGFGLGLAFCRLAVEGHGGKIWIEPTESHGARFVFSLPEQSNHPDHAE